MIQFFTERKFIPRFYQLALGSSLSHMMTPLASIFDTAFLGHLQDLNYLAGVILGGIIFDYLYRILKFLRNITTVMTAEASGQQDDLGTMVAGLRSGLIALVIGVLIILLQKPIAALGFHLLSGTPIVEVEGLRYFLARVWGAPAVLINFVLFGWFLGKEKVGALFISSFIACVGNIGLDYVMINQWGWGATGAGWATTISQYVALLFGLIVVLREVPWSSIQASWQYVFDWEPLKEAIIFKGNLLFKFLGMISAYAIFTNLSASMGTQLLTENGLILQIALLSQFTVNGVSMATQTLVGNFQGKGDRDHLIPILMTAFMTGLPVASFFCFTTYLCPEFVFGLLTNHGDLNLEVHRYSVWLIPLTTLTATGFMLESFFMGLKETAIVRNAALASFFIGFLPIAITAFHYHNNHLLWSSLVGYMLGLNIVLGVHLWKTYSNQLFPLKASKLISLPTPGD
jgi:MATE family multidrug resistance protein